MYSNPTNPQHLSNLGPQRLRRTLGASLAGTLIFLAVVSIASDKPAIKTGLEVGAAVPSFEAPDQNDQMHDLKSILGPKGAMLVFFRSADW
jgi:hypothetical protein